MPVTLDLHKNKIRATISGSKDKFYGLLEVIKNQQTRTYDEDDKAWLLPVESFGQLRKDLEQIDNVKIDSKLEDFIVTHGNQRLISNLESNKYSEEPLIVENFHGTLKPFQCRGVRFLVGSKRSLLADSVGLGKTVEALA